MLVRTTRWLKREKDNLAFLEEIREQINKDNPNTAIIVNKNFKTALFCKKKYLRAIYDEVTNLHYAKARKDRYAE